MQAIIKTLDTINYYIGYLYIVIVIVLMVMAIRVLLTLINLSHSTSDFDMAMESVHESYTNYRSHKKRIRFFCSNILKVMAAYHLSRMYLSREKRAQLHKKKDKVTLRTKHDKYVKRLLKD